jgi:hypothetical protein
MVKKCIRIGEEGGGEVSESTGSEAAVFLRERPEMSSGCCVVTAIS